jgi:hypothetical protein
MREGQTFLLLLLLVVVLVPAIATALKCDMFSIGQCDRTVLQG